MLWRILLTLAVAAAVVRAESLPEAVEGYLAQAEAEPAPEEDPNAWKINLGLGATYTSGNSDLISIAFTISADKKLGEKWQLKLGWLSLFAKSNGVESANEHILTERIDYILSEKASVFQTLLVEHDELELLDLRILFTLGYKRQLVKNENFELSGEAGAGYSWEDFRNRGIVHEAIVHLGLDWFWTITKQLTYKQVFRLYPSLNYGGEFLFVSVSTFSTPIGKNLSLNLELVNRYDSDAVAPTKKNDFSAVLTLNYTF
jgi:putative salt-induced outer membrane protein